MAKASKTTTPVDATQGLSVTITQQALNLARQIVAAQGWAKAIQDIYVGGKLLAETLPALDPLDWVRPDTEIKAMKDKERAEYLAKDKAWGEKKVSFSVTDVERDAIERAFNHFVQTAASAKQLGPNQYLFELIVTFDIKDTPIEKDKDSSKV